jgi:hypothetical protein
MGKSVVARKVVVYEDNVDRQSLCRAPEGSDRVSEVMDELSTSYRGIGDLRSVPYLCP